MRRSVQDPLQAVHLLGHSRFRLDAMVATIIGLASHGLGVAMLLGAGGRPVDLQNVSVTEVDTYVDLDAHEPEPSDETTQADETTTPEVAPPLEPDRVEPAPGVGSSEGDDTEPYEEAPPVAALDIVSREPDADAPLDMTDAGWDMVDGQGSVFRSGVQTSRGRSTPTAKRGGRGSKPRRAGTGGRGEAGGGAGTARGGGQPKSASLAGGTSWKCPFPAQADVSGTDYAVTVIVVRVSVGGAPTAVQIVSDPGHGFGAAARSCAMSRRYAPAVSASGIAVAGQTPPISVRFTR